MVQDIENTLKEAILKQTSKVDYFAYVENISPVLAVHEVRKAYKRIVALLKFFPLIQSDFPVNDRKEITALGKTLSDYRNSCVNLHILGKVAKENPHISERKLKSLKKQFSEKCRKELDEIIKAKLGERIREHIKNFETGLNHTNLILPEKKVSEELQQTFRKSFKMYKAPGIFANAERLHSLRKCLKQLFYQSVFLKNVDARFFKNKSYQLNIITELLGDDHDLYVFLEELKKAESGLDSEEFAILENKVKYLGELNLHKYQPRLKQFFTETPESFSTKIKHIFSV